MSDLSGATPPDAAMASFGVEAQRLDTVTAPRILTFEALLALSKRELTIGVDFIGGDEEHVVLVFRRLLRDEWRRLVNEHPPTPEQLRRAKEAGDLPSAWNADTFTSALISATLTEPRLTPAEVDVWLSRLGSADATALFLAAVEVCQTTTVKRARA